MKIFNCLFSSFQVFIFLSVSFEDILSFMPRLNISFSSRLIFSFFSRITLFFFALAGKESRKLTIAPEITDRIIIRDKIEFTSQNQKLTFTGTEFSRAKNTTSRISSNNPINVFCIVFCLNFIFHDKLIHPVVFVLLYNYYDILYSAKCFNKFSEFISGFWIQVVFCKSPNPVAIFHRRGIHSCIRT